MNYVWLMRARSVLVLMGMLVHIPIVSAAAQHREVLATDERCQMSVDNLMWINRALADWQFAERHELRLKPKPLPPIVVFDARCEYLSISHSGETPLWRGREHKATISLPDGKTIPFGVVSFAAHLNGKAEAGFFVMSLPSVWRTQNVQSGLGLERLMDGVFLHEMSHTRQFYFVNPAMERLTKKYHLTDDIGDDSIQDAFSKNPKYVADYERERDLLYQAALARNNVEARVFAKEALDQMRARRSAWFTGRDEYWETVDEVFLTMEGLGQWTAYAWFVDPAGPHLDPSLVLPEVRRKRNRWTQDEGLALFLTVNRLVPGWQHLAFARQPELAEALLQRAVSSK